MRLLTTVTIILLFCFNAAVASGGLTDIEEGLLELFHARILYDAVNIEMKLHFGLVDKDSLYDISSRCAEAGEDLTVIRNNLLDLSIPAELSEAKTLLAEALAQSIYIYNTILEQGGDIDFVEEYRVLDELPNEYYGVRNYCVEEYSLMRYPGIERYDHFEYEIGLFENIRDRELFEQAKSMIDNGEYLTAGRILEGLLEEYKGAIQEGSIITRIADCIELGAYDDVITAEIGNLEYSVDLLYDFIEGGEYSPNIAWMFYQWRTLKQFHLVDGGVSNWGNIPNDEYIAVLWGIIETCEQHLSAHPDDLSVKYQIILLLDIPLIDRWGPRSVRSGNSVWSDYNYFWPF